MKFEINFNIIKTIIFSKCEFKNIDKKRLLIFKNNKENIIGLIILKLISKFIYE